MMGRAGLEPATLGLKGGLGSRHDSAALAFSLVIRRFDRSLWGSISRRLGMSSCPSVSPGFNMHGSSPSEGFPRLQ